MPPAAVLPNQNQLYAYYLSRCGHYRVGKPNSAVLQLLAENEPSRLVRLKAESVELGIPVSSVVEMEMDTGSDAPMEFGVLPLAQQTMFRLAVPASASAALTEVYIGARGMMPLLELVSSLPLIEEIDLSNVSSWFTGDAAAAIAGPGGITGNDVVRRLCQVIAEMPALRRVDISAQPIGSLAAQWLLDAALASPRLVDLRLARGGVDSGLYYKIHRVLEQNARNVAAALPAVPPLPTRVADRFATLPVVDRKTLREQQLLRAMMAEDDNFAGALSPDQLSELVLRARVMSVQEVVSRCRGRGLRGDGLHLFVIKSGAVRAFMDLRGLRLQRGDCFGDTYSDYHFSTCRIEQEESGTVFAVPLSHCGALLEVWERRLAAVHSSAVKVAPLLQPTDAWTRMRVATCCTEAAYKAGEVVLPANTANHRIWLVVGKGSFAALPGTAEDKVLTGRYELYPIERLEFFGIEALVAGRRCSSVAISAGASAMTDYRCAVVAGSAVRLLREQLWAVMAAAVRPYSLHEDLRQTAKKNSEWAYCI